MAKIFDILEYLDRLQEHKRTATQVKFICPVCGGDNLAVNLNSGKWKCWNNCDNYDVKRAIAPEIYGNRFAPIDQFEPAQKTKEYPLRKKLNTVKLAYPSFSLAILRDSACLNKTTFIYDDHHRVVRWDNADGKVLVPYYLSESKIVGNNSAEWIKGVDGAWKPFVPPKNTEGIYVGVEGEKCVEVVVQKGLTAFTFAIHCWNHDYMVEALNYLKTIAGFKGILYVGDNDRAGRQKAHKVSLAARECEIPHEIINIIDIWYYVVDQRCPSSADLADLINLVDFNLEKLLCSTIELMTPTLQQHNI